MMNTPLARAFGLLMFATASILPAQVPNLLNYQGRVVVGTTNVDGSGQFKFALVSGDGTTTYWSNDGTSTAGSEPAAAVTLAVTKGLYAVRLGDTSLGAGMTAIPHSVFANADVRLRIWFSDGTPTGFQLLTPDQRLAAVGYAMMAASVSDGAITAAKIAPGTIDSTHLSSGLTLGGTTTGTFSGGLTGNVTGNAINFTGSLVGDVTGTQGATVVSLVGGSTAANVHAAELLANAATSAGTASAIVRRDASGNFSTGSITLAGSLELPATSSASVGVITQGGTRLLHTFGTNNFFAGAGAGNVTMTGANNTAVSLNALSSNTTGYQDTAVGVHALRLNTTGKENTALGANALEFNTTGDNNTAIGRGCLEDNTVGYNNTAAGLSALRHNTTGNSNTSTGAETLMSNTNGEGNTANGTQALRDNSTGNHNTACGSAALLTNTTGLNNVAIGHDALLSNTTGNSNIAIGLSAGSALTTGSDNIAIGNTGIAGESNTIRVGTGGYHTRAFIAGISGVTSSGGTAVFVNSSGQLGTTTSSRRFKDDIATMNKASEVILSLRPVTFRYKPELDAKGIPQFGLIAEEVNDIAPALVIRDDKGEIQTVRYEAVNAMLLNEFLKDHQRAQLLEKRVAELEARDREREARLLKLEQFILTAPDPQGTTVGNANDE